MKKSALQRVRAEYQPKLPKALQGPVKLKIGEATQSVADQEEIKNLFPHTYGMPIVEFVREEHPERVEEPFNVGIILSGGQAPEGGAIVPNNASIVLYLGEEKNDESRAVPNVLGMTAAEANQALTNAGFIMRVTGATSTESGNVKAISQDRGEGTELPPGTVVTVRFGDSSVRD